jgi:hypothetical protein
MSKHTPGPWKVFICDDGGQWSGWPLSIFTDDTERTIVRPGGFYPYEWDRGVSEREAVANARLIAAAPDLLEAVKELMDLPLNHPISMTVDERKRMWAAHETARAAIAKAEGQS